MFAQSLSISINIGGAAAATLPYGVAIITEQFLFVHSRVCLRLKNGVRCEEKSRSIHILLFSVPIYMGWGWGCVCIWTLKHVFLCILFDFQRGFFLRPTSPSSFCLYSRRPWCRVAGTSGSRYRRYPNSVGIIESSHGLVSSEEKKSRNKSTWRFSLLPYLPK